MFIIHGKKRVEKKLGFVADYCPVCHAIRRFTLKQIFVVPHLYYIPMGKGTLVQDRIECSVCGLALGANLSTYATVEKHPVSRSDTETLLRSTFPNLRQVYASRLAFEEGLKKNPRAIDHAARAQYVFELFRLVNPQVEACFKRETRFDKQSGLGCIGSLVIFGVLLGVGLSLRDNTPQQDWTVIAAVSVLILGMIYTLAQLALVPRRIVRKRLLPMLARGLHPLDPLEAELAAVLEKCKSSGMYIGKKIKLPALMLALRMPLRESFSG